MTTRLLYRFSGRAFLTVFILVAMIPFLDLRVLRMAGDEKVYVTTAVEMARSGSWFVQTLADEPSYFKGPLHYILIRIGMLVFGDRLVAGTWMNAALALLAGLAMYRLGRRRWDDKRGLLLGIATGLNVGVFSHALASQMEVELCAFYAFATAALGLATGEKPSFRRDAPFWLAAGIAGWAKSPMHAVLIGTGGLLYWALSGQLAARLRSRGAWGALACGLAAGVIGYVPAAVLDFDNFHRTFILREQFEKANNQRKWDYVVTPLVHFALPWTFVVLAGALRVFKAPRSMRGSTDVEMVKLGFSMAAPSLLFWSLWTYKGQNYNLPAMAPLLLFGWGCFKGAPPRLAFRAAGVLGALAFLAAVGVAARFWPFPAWWGMGWLLLGFASTLVFAVAFLFAEDSRVLAAGAAAMFVAFGSFITPLGEREMVDVRQFMKEHPGARYYYYNLDPSIWSEWSLLQLTLHHRVNGLHRRSQLQDAVRPGTAVVVQNTNWLNDVTGYWRENHETGAKPPVVTPWTRWLTKGRTPDGKSRWRAAWTGRDLHQLEREFFILWFPN